MSFKNKEYYDEIFKNINIPKDTIKSIEFDNCIFKNCIFNEVVFQFCKFTECSFENCDLSLLKPKDSIFNDITISNSKAIGINWTICGTPFEVNFNNSDISMSSFYELDLRQSKIISCKANDVDFAKVNLEKVNLKDTDLLGSTFESTNFKSADLTTAKNYAINPEFNYIKNMKVSLPQAISFLNFLELDIVK